MVDKINGVQQTQNITKPASTAETQKEESSIFSGIKEAVITDEGNTLGEFRGQQYELDFKNGFLGLGDTKITGNINGKK